MSNGPTVAEVMEKARKQDLNRQEQIENQKAAINRLLDDRNAAEQQLRAIRDVCREAVAEGNNSTYIDRIVEVLGG